MSLWQDSGGSTNDRRVEADRLLDIIGDPAQHVMQFGPKDMEFIRSMRANRERAITAKMLFWLRDLKDKTL